MNTVLALLGAEEITMERLPVLIANGVVFKWFVAVVDTPLVYGAVWFMKNRLGIEETPEVETRKRRGIF